jgi:apolipoprotein N-acyltransferase
MNAHRAGWARLLAAAAAGVLHALSFAPFDLPWLQVVALAVLFALTTRASGPWEAARLGFGFGLGWFGLGVSWVYISMHTYGLMPAPLAAAATAAFCAFLALYPAAALGVAQRLARVPVVRLALTLPACWTLSEGLRGTLLTGFPWLAGGYAHTDGPLAGFAPLIGVYGVGFVAATLAGALAVLALPHSVRGARAYVWIGATVITALAGGSVAGEARWTRPAGAPIQVALVQANIPQDAKFTVEGLRRAFGEHWALMQGVRADLVALPESVFPVPLGLVPEQAIEAFRAYARERDSALIFGVFIEEPHEAFHNSAVGWSPRHPDWQRYSKQHLVPFGEFIPWGFRWFVDLMQMPIGDQAHGSAAQPPMELAGQRIAVNICYEDLFGDVIRSSWMGTAAPPTIMLNLSNLAWFDDSIALPQHLQISRMRTLETQHPMLRSTNTGVTAIIDAQGRVAGVLPILTAGVLQGEVQGHEGETPFIRYGNAPALVIAGLLILMSLVLSRRGRT